MDFQIKNGVLGKYSGKDTRVVIPDGVTAIGEWSFAWCESLTQVTIPPSVTKIGGDVFGRCESLTQVTIPPSVTAIGEWSFAWCESLTQVTIPPSVTEIGKGAFEHCQSLTQMTIPPSVTAIGDWAFEHCQSLTQMTLPPSVTKIGENAFCGCTSLAQVTIPSSVTAIGKNALPKDAFLESAVFMRDCEDAAHLARMMAALGWENLLVPFVVGKLKTSRAGEALLEEALRDGKMRRRFMERLIGEKRAEYAAALLSRAENIPADELDAYIEKENGCPEIRIMLMNYRFTHCGNADDGFFEL